MTCRRWVTLALALVLVTSLAEAQSTLPPRRKKALLAWLQSGAYRATFTPEPEVRLSFTAHGRFVRSWYSPTLVEDLRAGRVPFRKGAAMVKELYLEDPTRLAGFSVMRKLRPRSGTAGRGWLFYETLDGTNAGAYFGRGLRVCTECHASGVDYLRSDFRP